MYKLKRALSFSIDFVLIASISVALSFLGPQFDWQYLLMPSVKMFSSYGVFLAGIWFVLAFLLKDVIFGNASIGKKLLGLHVESQNSEQVKRNNLILRNVTLLFFAPIECLIALFNSGIRLGDIIAQTRVNSK